MKKVKREPASPREPTTLDADIGSRVRQRRLAINMSQSDLGKKLGVSFQQIQKYELGLNRISAARLYEICKTLKAPLSSMSPKKEPSPSYGSTRPRAIGRGIASTRKEPAPDAL
jgi:transcriptional regulator with XRE-family HTH domain